MKHYLSTFKYTTFAGMLAMLTLVGCEEVVPPGLILVAPPPPPEGCDNLLDTVFTESPVESPQDKVVLFEEFTGVQCVNCPAGHEKSAELLANNPGKIILIAVHSGGFAEPIPILSQVDFNTEEGDQIDALVGGVTSWPAATIDRKLFTGEDNLVLTLGKWTGYFNDQSALTPPVNIYLTTTYDSTDRELLVMVELKYTSTVSFDHSLSVTLTEGEIIDAQFNEHAPTGIDTFYVHEHVLRDMLTPFNGTAITANTESGTVIQKEFCHILDASWDPGHMEVVAFVNRTGTEHDILQAASAYIID